jgi:hypothetical protein
MRLTKSKTKDRNCSSRQRQSYTSYTHVPLYRVTSSSFSIQPRSIAYTSILNISLGLTTLLPISLRNYVTRHPLQVLNTALSYPYVQCCIRAVSCKRNTHTHNTNTDTFRKLWTFSRLHQKKERNRTLENTLHFHI